MESKQSRLVIGWLVVYCMTGDAARGGFWLRVRPPPLFYPSLWTCRWRLLFNAEWSGIVVIDHILERQAASPDVLSSPALESDWIFGRK